MGAKLILPLALAVPFNWLFDASAIAAKPNEEAICVSVLHLWTGTNDDIRRISTIPVPDSYRSAFDQKPCNTLDKPALVTWHLRFGGESSATSALAFLENNVVTAVVRPDIFMRDAEPQ